MTKAQEAYYHSDHWINFRQKAKEVFIYGCILTKSPIYDLHHLNYLNMGKEKFWLDILPLSPEIHEDFHKWASLNKCGFNQLLDYAINKKIDLTPGAFKILKRHNLIIIG